MNITKNVSSPQFEDECATKLQTMVMLVFCITTTLTCIMTAQSVRPQTYNQFLLHEFTGLVIDGVGPLATSLVRDSSGDLYGTTAEGGAYGQGTVFRLSPGGQMTVLHSFSAGSGDGNMPIGSLALDANGVLYGTTLEGGSTSGYCQGFGSCGIVFKLNTHEGGQYSILYTFQGPATGVAPTSGVILDASGNLYGATWAGGTNGLGTLFQLEPNGQFNVLYNFGENPDDGTFTIGLARDAQGNIFGADLLGGPYASSNCLQGSYVPLFGCGVVFKVDPTGQETLLHTFSGVAGDGGSPAGAPILDSNGNLYGTALVGGTGTCQGQWFPTGGCGTVFKVDTDGNYSTLYSFPGTGGSGAGPVGDLALDSSGNLYGATEDGDSGTCNANASVGGGYWTGYPGCGVAFKLSTSGVESVLNQFTGANGGNPESGFIMDSSGNLYGTTYDGGDLTGCGDGYGCGTVFELSPNGSLVHRSHI